LKKSLFSKLLIMNIGVIAAALVVIALLLPQLISGYIFNQKERELTAKGTELARLTEGYLEETISEESFLELLASLDRFLEARIWVVNRDGLVIKASYGERLFRRGPYLRLSEEQVKQLSRGETLTARRYLPHFEQVMLSVGVPVLFGADRVPAGAIILHAPVTEIKATVSSLLKFVLFSGLAAVVLASLLGYFFSRRLSRPLQEMSAAARRMGRGHFSSRIKISSEDELGQLAFSLNYLAERLEHTITALQREKSKFKSMVAGMREGVVGVNSAGELVYLNNTAREMLQLDDASLGRPVAEVFPSPRLAAPFLHSLAGGKPEAATVDLKDRYYSVRVSPAEDETDATPGAVGLIQDISETERLEQMRRDFIANASHELRTPLTVLKGYAEALLDGTADDTRKTRYLQIIKTEIERLNRLVTDLLDLSRLQAGRLALRRERLSLVDLAVELGDRLKPQLKEKRLRLEAAIPENAPVWADRDRIQQVMQNLVENAVRFSPHGGTIFITAAVEPGGKVKIAVRDEGPGIPAEDLPHIWERFYRAEKSRDRKKGGTGLGLAIAREIIEAHGETIAVASTAGQGTVFSFTLPPANG
jgi:two-component system sensor histidine kinase ResE